MRAALAAGVPVNTFWQLSLREWRWLASADAGSGLSGAELNAMIAKFPDKDEN